MQKAKSIRYRLEAVLTRFAAWFFGKLPLPIASAIGGWVMRMVGPFTRVYGVALKNLKDVMPECSDKQRSRILSDMWDNLGRVFCEYPHLSSNAMRASIKHIDGIEHVHRAMKDNKPIILISGHLGNWELLPVAAAKCEVPIHLLYRAANNQAVDDILAKMRSYYTLGLHAKGLSSAKGLLQAVKNKEPIGVLVDQKTNNGMASPFFGRDAMTLDAIAHFVHKYDACILPARCIREHKTRFRVVIEPPLGVSSGDSAQHITNMMNQKLESWVREDPGQWFWVHRRWPVQKDKAA